MRYCTRCLYPENHPLNITFDEHGVCSGCHVHEEKDKLNWKQRSKKLGDILYSYTTKSGKSYDCIIPVSGARDSYFIVHTIKNVYKKNPLLVTYNKQYNTALGIRNLAYLKTLFGCDMLTLTVNPDAVKKITRRTLQKMGSMYWHCLAGTTAYPVQTAVRFKIPLIIWGAHQGCDQVGMFSHMDEVEMTHKYRKDHDLMGYEAEDLIGGGVTKEDVRPFVYPSDKEIEKVGVRGIYLSNYIRWDSKKQHEDMIAQYGYETAYQERTFDTYNDVDCFNYSSVHDYIKFLKHGYGKVTDHASREIRLKRLTREQGIDLVKKYQNLKPSKKSLSLFLKWVGMNKKDFYKSIDAFRSSVVWEKSGMAWKLKDSIVCHAGDEGVDSVRLRKKGRCEFKLTKPKKTLKDDTYTLLGRGWADDWKQ
ncbi:LPS biosynthesis protein [bacterium CG10_46_32]|nr:MAG: LPS biosynthesis protein [bacterium CG10_46_32]PIR56344.1 MAG: N-acetyl sugar amidotransferase [Parcubacteria group bacterium CG10_big_fil_rev_8_21_14_0_10_46_32]